MREDMRQLKIVIYTCLCLMAAGCGLLPREPSLVDRHTVYAWPLETCPSQPDVRFLPVLGGILVGDLISGLVGVPASALSAAADADKQGFSATGINDRFYYNVEEQNNKYGLVAPACYVVAYTQTSSDAKSWCDDPDFKKGVAKTCNNGQSILDKLAAKEHIDRQAEPYTDKLELPEFYAEIAFEKSGFEDIVRPKVIALYYPKSLLQPDSSKARHLTISLSFTSPLTNDPLKAASVAIDMVGVTPGQTISQTDLVNARSAWTSVPVVKPTDTLSTEGPYLPVTITASIHEVGDPSLFLAAFAKAVSGSSADYSKAISNEILPSARATAQELDTTNQASYNSAVAAAASSYSSYLTGCTGKTLSAAGNANEMGLYYAVIANRQKANVAAQTAGQSLPFASTAPSNNGCFNPAMR
jgi:hypothetical protein